MELKDVWDRLGESLRKYVRNHIIDKDSYDEEARYGSFSFWCAKKTGIHTKWVHEKLEERKALGMPMPDVMVWPESPTKLDRSILVWLADQRRRDVKVDEKKKMAWEAKNTGNDFPDKGL